MNYEEILLKSISDNKYYTNDNLRYYKEYGFLLSSNQLNEYIRFKEDFDCEEKIELPLKSWNSKRIYLYKSNELKNTLNDFIQFHINDYKEHKSTYVDRNLNEVLLGIICSELEGTLNIEGVNTTRRHIEEVYKKNNPKDKNEKIIVNMFNGLKFISETDEINKENLKKLYEILSDGCLKKEDELKDLYYRNDKVYIAKHEGCPVELIDECMDSLFKFINDNIKTNDIEMSILLPFIVHYYFVYIHPYFDYNGRTARMVQLWLFLLINEIPALYLSEAINDNKNDYYKAINETRYSNNDVTYFVTYLVKLLNNYSMVQKNLEEIKKDIENTGESISVNELQCLKRIIINKNIIWFNYKKFNEIAGLSITKQGSLKILNKFEKMDFLISKINSKNEKVFSLNENIIKFEIK